MIQTKKGLLMALVAPILALALLTAYKKYILSTGREVVLPISGYDPRDLLSGHYLAYTIDYGVGGICQSAPGQSIKVGHVCLAPKKFSSHWPEGCELLIKGVCHHGQFKAGIERYYVPEKEAKKLEGLIRSSNASVVLAVPQNGKAQIKGLLINGKPWRDQ